MKSYLKTLFSGELAQGGLLLFLSAAVVNFLNYLYHLAMGRLLGPAQYGALESLISLIYITGVPLAAVSTVIVKYVSSYKGEKRFGAIGKLFTRLNQELLRYGTILFLLFLASSPLIANFLNLGTFIPIVFVGLIGLIGIFSGIARSFLQGLLNFRSLALVGVIETVLKLILAVALVLVGFAAGGAIAGILISSILGYFLYLKLIRRQVAEIDLKEKIGRASLFRYALPVFFSTLAYTSLFTSDIILARHYLPEYQAGLYAALATLGKIVFFTSVPIVMVMFPLVSQRQAQGKKYTLLAFQSLGLLGLLSTGLTVVYFLFPKLVVSLLYGERYLPAAQYLGFFAIFLSFYSLSSLLTNFYLSLGRTKIVVFPLLAAFLQIMAIAYFHRDIFQLVMASDVLVGLLAGVLVVYFLVDEENRTSLIGDRSRV